MQPKTLVQKSQCNVLILHKSKFKELIKVIEIFKKKKRKLFRFYVADFTFPLVDSLVRDPPTVLSNVKRFILFTSMC